MRTRNVEWPIQVMLGSRVVAATSYGIVATAPGRGFSETASLRRKKGKATLIPGNRGGGANRRMAKEAKGASPAPLDGEDLFDSNRIDR